MKQKGLFKTTVIAIFLIIVQQGFSQGQFFSSKEKNYSIPKYEVIDIGFIAKKKIDKPFSVNFGATIAGPNGEEIKVPGFYNGDKLDNNANATPKSDHMLELLANNGINQIVTTVYSYDVKSENYDWTRDEKLKQFTEHEFGGKDEIYLFQGTNKNPDFSSLNVTFFKRFDRMVSAMDKNDIVAHLMIYVWNKKVNWPAAETEADNMYFDYIIKRYQAFPNVIWDVSKEALNNKRCSEEYGRERISRIDSLDAYDRLATVHDFGFCVVYTDIEVIRCIMINRIIYWMKVNYLPSLTNSVVNIKRKAKATGGSVDFLLGLTTNHGICQRTII